MQRIQAISFPNTSGMRGPQRWAVIGLVGLLHVGLIYALITGLAARFVEQIPSIIQVAVVKQSPQIRHEVPPPPAPQLAIPVVPQIPIPQVRIAHTEPAPHAITAVAVPKPVVAPPKPAPAPVVHIVPPVAAQAIAGTHTTPPYPPVSRRLDEEGTVRLRIALDSGGAIRKVDIIRSSGHDRLDQAAVDWIAQHWR